MAALRVKEDSSGRLTLQAPMMPRVGNVATTLVWLGLFAIMFLLPMLTDQRVDWESLLIFLIVLVVSLGSLFFTTLITTTVTIDRGSRALTNTRRLLVVPIRATTVKFSDLANVEVQYHRQTSGRFSQDAWRVNAVARDGKRVALNWDGKRDEMFAFARKVAALTGAEVLDSSAKPISMLERILGEEEERAPAPQPAAPATPEVSAPSPAPAYALPEPTPTLAPTVNVHALSFSELERRVQRDAMDSEARYALARKYHARGQLDRATTLYQEALRLDPANAEAQNDLGVALQARGKRTEAEVAYRRAVALDPFSSTVHLNLALLLRAMNRAAQASQEFYQARQNARGEAERRAAEAAAGGARVEPRLSRT